MKTGRKDVSMDKENHCDDREAKIIRERRDELYMTQLQVAVEAGLGLQEYQRYEYGKAKLSNARMKVGLRICAALELDPYEAVFENGRDMAGVHTERD